MSLEHILKALETEAGRQLNEIEQAAKIEIERVLNQAQTEAEAIRCQHLVTYQARLKLERTRLLNRARQTAAQIGLNTRETQISAALATTIKKLAALSTTAVYPELLCRLTQEAVNTLQANQEFCLHVRAGDVELMDRIVRELGISATVVGDLETLAGQSSDGTNQCLGGVVVTTGDGRISLNNTLQTRLQRVATLYRASLAEIIFDQQPEG